MAIVSSTFWSLDRVIKLEAKRYVSQTGFGFCTERKGEKEIKKLVGFHLVLNLKSIESRQELEFFFSNVVPSATVFAVHG